MSKIKFINIIKFLIYGNKKDINELYYKLINKEFDDNEERKEIIDELINTNNSRILYSLIKYAHLMKE
ncbi:MAG: hypothetical protein IKP65_07935 [Alphaproteobacteria bacterium]|nr:hypothetical protein [Alphaproteobacteria bacterium]